MKALLRFTLTQGVLINVLWVAVVLLALIWALPGLPIERYPNFNMGEVRITTRYPGASPEEVERLVTDRIEDALRDMADIEFVQSTSIANQSSVHVKFIDDTDYDALHDELRLRVLGVQNLLPTVAGEALAPRVDLIDVDEWVPLVQLTLVPCQPGSIDHEGLLLLGKQLRLQLEAVPGVKEVMLEGEEPRQLVIGLDPLALQRHGLSLQEVVAALRRSGTPPPAGLLRAPGGTRQLRIDTRYRTPENVLAVPVRRDGDGAILRLADVVDRSDLGLRRIEGGIPASMNGRDAIGCKVLKLEQANAITTMAAVEAKAEAFMVRHADAPIELVRSLDGTVTIRDGIGVLRSSLVISAILVMVLLLVFLDRHRRRRRIAALLVGAVATALCVLIQETWVQLLLAAGVALTVSILCRAAVLTLSGIVFSFLGALLLVHLGGYSINEISLLGFVLVTGIVVDDAIVVLENIQRHRERGRPLHAAVIDGTAEVFWPVTSATLTTVAAFLPMLLMTGTVGEFFSLIPIAVCAALAISLIECLFILPLHVVDAERLLGPDPNAAPLPADAVPGPVLRRYEALLAWTLRRPALVVAGIAVALLLATLILSDTVFAASQGRRPLVRNQFFPDDAAVLDAFLTLPPDTAMEQTDTAVRRLAADLDALGPGWVTSVTGMAGLQVDSAYRPVFGDRYGLLMIEVPSQERRAFADNRELLTRARAVAEACFADSAVDWQIRPRSGGPPIGPPLSLRLTGIEDAEVDAALSALRVFLATETAPGGRLSGVVGIADDRRASASVLRFRPDAAAIAIHGLDEATVAAFVADAVEGAWIGDLRQVDDDLPIRVRLARHGAVAADELLQMPLVAGDQRLLGLHDLGDLELVREPERLVRRNFQRTVTVTGLIAEDAAVDAGSLGRIVRSWWTDAGSAFPGVRLGFEGEAESTAKSYASLAAAFIVAMALIYGILAAQFRSYLQPFLIMSNILFSVIGVVLGLALFGLLARAGFAAEERSWITVQVFIAVVGLTGLVVNDAIVLLDFINRRRREGLARDAALLDACRQRLRPILMTTATTVAGLLPMAIGIPRFNVTWSPFATAFAVGLCVSTTLTLLGLPALYQLLDRGVVALRPRLQRLLPGLRQDLPAETGETP